MTLTSDAHERERLVARSEARQAFLLALQDRLLPLADAAQIQFEAARALGEHLGAARVGYAEIEADGEHSLVTRNYTNGVRGIEGRYRVADYAPALLEALRAGRSVVRDDVAAAADLSDAERAAHVAIDVAATVDVPLLRDGQLTAVLFAHFREPHAWSAEELTLLADVAARTWDAVERARAEAALAASDADYRRVFDAIDQAFHRCEVITDEAGQVVDFRLLAVNPAWARTTRLDPVTSVGRTCRELVPTIEEAWIQACGRAGVHRETLRVEQEISALGKWYDVHLVPFGTPESRQFVATAADITARKRTDAERERLLRQAEGARERTALLQALTAALATASTPDEVARAVVTHATAAFRAAGTVIACLTRDGTHLEILRAGAMPDNLREAWSRFPVGAPVPLAEVARTGEPLFLESREAWSARYPHLAAMLDDTGHHANAVAPLVVDGRVTGVLGAAFATPRAFDAEDRAQIVAVAQLCAQALERTRLFEAERRARQEAEGANRAKGEFLAVMSHELRTPLNAIGGYAELLELGIRGPITDAQRADLARIQQSQRHLLGLINQVLNYTRVGAGVVRYDVSSVPAAAALRAAEALVLPQAQARGLVCVVDECPPGLTLRADGDKLQQVLLNLLTNAIKFTDAPGEVRMSCVERGARVAVTVADTGIGIAPDKLATIFEPFVQVDQRLTRPHEGVGLGLAISRELARGMGGDLTAESTPGAGSRFTLTLPAA